jgi:hypothetical protein
MLNVSNAMISSKSMREPLENRFFNDEGKANRTSETSGKPLLCNRMNLKELTKTKVVRRFPAMPRDRDFWGSF